jgi:hypothetical protein
MVFSLLWMMTEKLNELQKDVLRTLPNAGLLGKSEQDYARESFAVFLRGESARHEEANA